MIELESSIYELERGFWTEGAEFYRAHADDSCLVVFPGMVRLLSNAELAETVTSGPRWQDLEIEPKGMTRPVPGIVVIAYEASAQRGDERRYRAAISSGYVDRGGLWKLAWHQQTPL
jgi:hypothetical protein